MGEETKEVANKRPTYPVKKARELIEELRKDGYDMADIRVAFGVALCAVPLSDYIKNDDALSQSWNNFVSTIKSVVKSANQK